jgi:hypothetical protein
MIAGVTPEDIQTVQHAWAELRRCRAALVVALTSCFDAAGVSANGAAALRAEWLVLAVEDLVGLLAAPSQLAQRARALGESWPDPLTAPSFAVEGRAWMGAAHECLETWTDDVEAAWREAWVLLSDVLAAEALSPFTEVPPADATEA